MKRERVSLDPEMYLQGNYYIKDDNFMETHFFVKIIYNLNKNCYANSLTTENNMLRRKK